MNNHLDNPADLHYLIITEPEANQSNQHFSILPVEIKKKQKPQYLYAKQQLIQGSEGALLFEKLLQTNKLHLASYPSPPLTQTREQTGTFVWIGETDGKKRLHCRTNGNIVLTLPVSPIWYINPITRECGKLATPMDSEIACILLSAPALREEEIQEIYYLLKNKSTEKEIKLTLMEYFQSFQAQVIFEKNIRTWYYDCSPTTKLKTSRMAQQHISLEQIKWFDFEMGLEIEGKRINLLPPLVQLLEKQLTMHSLAHLFSLPDDKIFYLNLPVSPTTLNTSLAISMGRLKKILSVLTELHQEKSLSSNQKLILSKTRLLELATLKKTLDIQHLKWYGDATPKQLIKHFQQFENNFHDPTRLLTLPSNFFGKLRHYQLQGLYWLQCLKKTGLSGILADDMGLGKTIQLLAHLCLEKSLEKNQSAKKTPIKPSLIIAPTSLVMNWANEISKFAPSLKTIILHGQARKQIFDQISLCDVVLTTYALLLRDEKILIKHHYRLLILDEAQYIKNTHTKIGQIARKFIAEQRICLTGTPIENHLGELWSLFHFLLPNLLGEKRQFTRLFREPIEKHHQSPRLQDLKQRIAPFFLRRTKQAVLSELPPKIDIVRSILMTDPQRELYENIRIALHEKIMTAIHQQGISRAHMHILSALLKLRQVCCDPRLLKSQKSLDCIDRNSHISAKLLFLTKLLPNLITEGRKILLFSQFTEMLALIESELIKLEIPYVKLTGQTSSEKRYTLIQQFQSNQVPLFLISLKAGGLGLNLTQADTVIHYDPWWNPAVENQATDRAHRIGQDKTLFVYKLITADTIEEKIQSLQESKKNLFNQLLGTTDQTQHFKALTLEDIENLFSPLS